MTVTTDVTENQAVLAREGRRLLEAPLGHLKGRVIPELRATLADPEDARAMCMSGEWGVEDGALLERLLRVAVAAEDWPGGTDAVQLGDAVTIQLPDALERFLVVHPLEASLDDVSDLGVLAAGPSRAGPPRR